MEMLQGVWKQHLRPRAVVGYGANISLPSPPNYVTRSPGGWWHTFTKIGSISLKIIKWKTQIKKMNIKLKEESNNVSRSLI